MNAYHEIISQLDRFVRKHNTNQLYRGLIYAIAYALLVLLTVLGLEYFGAFSSAIRAVLFWASVLVVLTILIKYIFLPLASLLKLRKGLSRKDAAKLIGKHFPSVADKLSNILELQEISENSPEISALVLAGIDQKSEELKPIPILSAINLKENLKHVKWAIIPAILLLGLFIVYPEFIKEPGKRLLAYEQEFLPQAPFSLEPEKRTYQVVEGTQLDIKVSLESEKLEPNSVYAIFGSYREALRKTSDGQYILNLNRVYKDLEFELGADEFSFGRISVEVLPAPAMDGFKVICNYPSHTGLGKAEFTSMGDLLVPHGTEITWEISTQNTDSISITGLENVKHIKRSKNNHSFKWRADNPESYGFYRANKQVVEADSGIYQVNIIRDKYPEIQAKLLSDSITGSNFTIFANIGDDYGFYALNLYIKDSNSSDYQAVKLNINPKTLIQEQIVNGAKIRQDLNLGNDISYYLEVRDNDALNGFKASKTAVVSYHIKTAEEIREAIEKQNKEQINSLDKNLEKRDQLNKQVKSLKEEILNKKGLDLNDKKKLQELIEKQKKLSEAIEKQIQEQSKKEELLKESSNSEESRQREEQLKDMMEKSNSDELDKLYEELEKLMNNLDQDKLLEKLNQMQEQGEQQSDELDRTLELMKKFALELQKENLVEDLKDLSEKQEQLSEKDQTSGNEQDQINKDFNKIKKDLEDIKKKEEQLEQDSKTTKEIKKKAEDISEEMKDTKESLDQGKNQKKSKEQQKQHAKEMEEMAEQMQSSMSTSAAEENAENIEDLKQILENLVSLSHSQESLYELIGNISTQDPKYNEAAIKQVNYTDDFQIIEDSLKALAKRVVQIQNVIYEEVGSVKKNMATAISEMAERSSAQVRMSQRYTLTSINNLSLLLNEVLEQLQKQQAQSKPGMANCNKPGSGKNPKPSLQKMRQAQQKMAEQMEKMMEKGKKPGEKGEKNKGDKKPGQGQMGESEAQQLVQMAAKQAALRKELRRLAQELNKDGKGSGNKLSEIAKEIEELEKDLFNNSLSPESLLRQREIITKMLEAEKAEQEQEMDNERKGEQGNQGFRSEPIWEEYIKNRNSMIEKLQSVPLDMKPYYRQKSEQYLNEKVND